MEKFFFLLSFSVLFVTTAFSQTRAPEAVGVVTGVRGLVTVSQGNTMGNAFEDEVVLQNARVVTTATGSTTIRLNNGCVIDLKPNQALSVDIRRECKAILAAIEPTGPVGVAGGVAAVGVPSGLNNAMIVGGRVLLGLGVIGVISSSNVNSALQRLSGS